MALTEEFGQQDMDNNLITEKEIRKYAQEQVETVEKYLPDHPSLRLGFCI